MTFLVQFGIYLWACGANPISILFEKYWLMQISSKLNSKSYEYLFKLSSENWTWLSLNFNIEMFSLAKLSNIKMGIASFLSKVTGDGFTFSNTVYSFSH